MSNKLIVIKLGTNVVTTQRNEVDSFRLEQLAKQILKLQENNFTPVLVVSGAVAVGLQQSKLSPNNKLNKQLAAGVGQAKLFNQLYSIFAKKRIKVAQFLLTRQDLDSKVRKRQICDVVKNSLDLGILPVFNENDVLSLYSFGGNDFLAEKIARLLSAYCLIILTDVDGFLDLPPNSTLANLRGADVIPEVKHLTAELKQKILPTPAKNGIGGTQAKVAAASNLQKVGIKTIIANGKTRDVLPRLLLNNEKLGTHFVVYTLLPTGSKV